MSKLEFDFEPLNKVLDGKEVTKDEAYEIFLHSEYNSRSEERRVGKECCA